MYIDGHQCTLSALRITSTLLASAWFAKKRPRGGWTPPRPKVNQSLPMRRRPKVGDNVLPFSMPYAYVSADVHGLQMAGAHRALLLSTPGWARSPSAPITPCPDTATGRLGCRKCVPK